MLNRCTVAFTVKKTIYSWIIVHGLVGTPYVSSDKSLFSCKYNCTLFSHVNRFYYTFTKSRIFCRYVSNFAIGGGLGGGGGGGGGNGCDKHAIF